SPASDSDSRKSRWPPAWLGSSEETANRIGKLLPDCSPLGESALAASGQCVDPTPPSGLGDYPATGKQACLLKTMQRGVDRSLREIERLAAPAPDFLDHRVAVRRPRRQRGEHYHVEVPLEHFAFHTLYDYVLAPAGSSRKGARAAGQVPMLSARYPIWRRR